MVVLAALIVYRWCYETGAMRKRLYYGTWTDAACSYGLLFVRTAPAVLGVVSFLNPHMLEALLLVRNETAFVDIFFHHTDFVFHGRRWPGSLQNRRTAWRRKSDSVRFDRCRIRHFAAVSLPVPSWPGRKRIVWWVLCGIFPALGWYTTIRNHTAARAGWATFWQLLLGVIAGWCAANLITLIIACLENWLLGDLDHTARAGVLPYEIYAETMAPPRRHDDQPGFVRCAIRWLFGDARHGFFVASSRPRLHQCQWRLVAWTSANTGFDGLLCDHHLIGYFWGLSNKD